MSSSTNAEPDPVAKARAAWQETQTTSDQACREARRASNRLAEAVTSGHPERIDALVDEAKEASVNWREAIAAEDRAYRSYKATKAAQR